VLRSDKAILASFILLPLARHENGRRAAEIVRTAPYAFTNLCFTNDRLKLAQIVTNSCMRMAREGLLREVGRRTHEFHIPYKWFIPGRPLTKVYESPVYNLTEAGMMRALSCADFGKLPELRTKTRKKKRKYRNTSNPYQNDSFDVSKTFLRMIE
jgi:hypothetical protein